MIGGSTMAGLKAVGNLLIGVFKLYIPFICFAILAMIEQWLWKHFIGE